MQPGNTKRRRGKASDYDADWRKLRAIKLADCPTCECDECKRTGAIVEANVVDHIIPVADRPDLRLEWTNLRSMAKGHHDAHTAATVGFGRSRSRGRGSQS